MISTQKILEKYETDKVEQKNKFDDAIKSHIPQDEKDDEEESKIYSKFANRGTEAIKTMTGFLISEFLELYSVVQNNLKARGRGRKPEISTLDSFFLTLVMLKHHEKWDKFALTYEAKKTTAYSAVKRTLERILEPLCNALIRTMFHDEQLKRNIKFDDFPEVALVVDVTFQTRTRPKMLFKDAQFYYSGKHDAYGYKTEVAHLPNGQAVFVSKTYGGSVHDFTIFKDNIETYELFLQKRGLDHTIDDNGELKKEYPKYWSLMADKGYQGANEIIRSIIPTKGANTKEEKIRNNKIAKNRVICENFYGRMKNLFKIMSDKYTWQEDSYSNVFNICVALTNYHITKYPLRNEEGIFYLSILDSYAEESLKKKKEQKEANDKYNGKKRKILLEK